MRTNSADINANKRKQWQTKTHKSKLFWHVQVKYNFSYIKQFFLFYSRSSIHEIW